MKDTTKEDFRPQVKCKMVECNNRFYRWFTIKTSKYKRIMFPLCYSCYFNRCKEETIKGDIITELKLKFNKYDKEFKYYEVDLMTLSKRSIKMRKEGLY